MNENCGAFMAGQGAKSGSICWSPRVSPTLKSTNSGGNTVPSVVILNPWDSQGVQIEDGTGIYPCVRGCGGGGYQHGYVLQHLTEEQNESI